MPTKEQACILFRIVSRRTEVGTTIVTADSPIAKLEELKYLSTDAEQKD